MAWLRTIIAWVTLSVIAAPVAAAAAEDPTEEGIQSGVALRKEGQDEAALALFLSLEQKSPQSVRVLLQVSAAAQATGRWVLAYNYLRKAAAYRNEPYYVRNRAIIKVAEDAVNQHVSHLRVVGEPSGAEVRLSGNLLGTLPLADAVPVELGSYTLEVTKPGFYRLRREVTLSAGGALNQELVELKRIPAASSAPAPANPQSVSEARRALQSSDRERSSWGSPSVTWVLGGLAVASAATSGVALVIRESNAEKWNDDEECLNRGDASRTRQEICGSHRATASTAETVAWTAGAAAGVFAIAAVVQHLTAKNEQPAKVAAASCGVGLGSLFCSGTF